MKERPNVTGNDFFVDFAHANEPCRLSLPVRERYLAFLTRERRATSHSPWHSWFEGGGEAGLGVSGSSKSSASPQSSSQSLMQFPSLPTAEAGTPTTVTTINTPLLSAGSQAVILAQVIRAEKGTLLERHASVFKGREFYAFYSLPAAHRACQLLPQCAGVVYYGPTGRHDTSSNLYHLPDTSLDEGWSASDSSEWRPGVEAAPSAEGVHQKLQPWYFLAQEDIGIQVTHHAKDGHEYVHREMEERKIGRIKKERVSSSSCRRIFLQPSVTRMLLVVWLVQLID